MLDSWLGDIQYLREINFLTVSSNFLLISRFFAGCDPIFESHDEAWLHWWIRSRRRSPWRQNCRQFDWQTQQSWCDFSQIWCWNQRHWKVDQQLVAFSSIRVSFTKSYNSTVWKLRNFTLAHDSQEFREFNILLIVLISRNIFSESKFQMMKT